MPTRTLGVALWEYRDHTGRKRRAFYGQSIELPEAEEHRGEKAGAFTADPTPRPTTKSTKAEIVDWLVNHGADPDEMATLNKQSLLYLLDASDNVGD